MRNKITAKIVSDFVKGLQDSHLSAQRIADRLAGFKAAAELGATLTQGARQEIATFEQYLSNLAFKKAEPIDKPIIDLFKRDIFPERGDSRV